MELIRELNDEISITSKEVLYNKYLKEFSNEDREYFIVIGLDSNNKALYREIVSIGGLNSSIVEPRMVFKKAIIMSCNSIIIAHNHPSGNLEPSFEDEQVTKKLIDIGNFLGIKVLDSLIVGAGKIISIK